MDDWNLAEIRNGIYEEIELQRRCVRHSAFARYCYSRSCHLNARCNRAKGSIMTTFDEREHAFEAKLAHDEELKFRARARRDKWLGLWAAGKLGKAGAAADDYASRLVATEIEIGSAGQILKTIRADFDRAGVDIPDHEIRRKMDELLVAAVEEIMKVAAREKAHRDES